MRRAAESGAVLVVAPHPDDEVLGAGGLIRRLTASGQSVHVALMTSGDGFVQDAERYYLSLNVSPDEYVHLGYKRQGETRQALARLGVDAGHVHFLGFPDGGLVSLLLEHWDGEPLQSPTTGYREAPYIDAYDGAKPYRGRAVLGSIMKLLEAVQPRLVVTPHVYDDHPDHWATNAFVKLAVSAWAEAGFGWARSVTHWGYLIHWKAWPAPLGYRPAQRQRAPEALLAIASDEWHEETLTMEDVSLKKDALMAYQSQVELIKPFLLAFARQSEMFAVERPLAMLPVGADASGVGLRVEATASKRARGLVDRRPRFRVAHWGVAGDRQQVTVELTRPLAEGMTGEVAIRTAAGRALDWAVSSAGQVIREPAPGTEVRIDGTRIVWSWPISVYEGSRRILAGIRLRNKGQMMGGSVFRVFDLDPGRDAAVSPTRT